MQIGRVINDKYLIVLDQGLLSVINFGSFLVLSKIAAIYVVSDFVVTYSYGYFIFIFSTLLLSSPILIFLSKKWDKNEGIYIGTSLMLNFFTNLFFALIAYFFLKQQVEGITFYNFFMLSFSMSFFDILKKFIFSSKNIQVKWGLYATILLNILFFSQLYLFKDNLELSTILSIYWISFFTANTLLLTAMVYNKINFSEFFKLSNNTFQFIKSVMKTHFHYSKWIIMGGIAFWGYSQGVYILAKSFDVSDFTIGKVRTIQNLLGVFNILMISLENHYTPIFSAKSAKGEVAQLPQMVYNVFKENYIKILGLFVLAIPIGLFFYSFIYGDKYGDGTFIFLLFLAVQLVVLISKPFSIALKSIENTIPFFISHIIAVISMLILVPLLLYIGNSNGLPIAITIANFIYVSYIIVHYFKKKKSFEKNELIR